MSNVVWHKTTVKKIDRESKLEQKSFVLWFTGLSASGKSTIANAVEKKLYDLRFNTYLLDGDNIRHGLNKDLGFDDFKVKFSDRPDKRSGSDEVWVSS